MLRALAIVLFGNIALASQARAGNTEDIVAGSDVALTGGAVVANVHTGGAMWFNPAGVARLDSRSVDLTGAVLSYNIIQAPGALSLESGEQSAGQFSALQAIPRALTFVASPRPALRWGVGFFFSRSRSKFLQDAVVRDGAGVDATEIYATADGNRSLYHVSSALAWKKSDRLLLGGGFDLVIAAQRRTEILSGVFSSGNAGTFNRSFNQALSGGGLQIKGGLQWAPIPEVRIGWMAATPSYLVYVNEESTDTRQVAEPGETPQFEGAQVDDIRGGWYGVERGLTRFGIAYLGSWGWLEADLVVGFPLQSEVFDLDWNATADVRLGGVFRLTERLKLGAGFFTDFSPETTPDRFGDTQIDFYGFTVGIDFANREAPPSPGEEGFYLAFAVAVRYAYGTGQLGGLLFADEPTDLSEPAGQLNLVGVRVNEIGVNVAVKASF